MNYRLSVLSQLCTLIKESKNYECERCTKRQNMSESTIQGRQEDKDVDVAIIEA